jgi:hypothetical protein
VAHKPPNLSIVVLDNEHYGETGMQKTVTGLGVDLVGIAKSAGLAQVKVSSEKLPLVLPPRDGAYLKNRFRIALLGPEVALA